MDMRTSVNGKTASWDATIWRKWQAIAFPVEVDQSKITGANYYTPRPRRNEYDRGHPDEGFVYTVRDREVWQVVINQQATTRGPDVPGVPA